MSIESFTPEQEAFIEKVVIKVIKEAGPALLMAHKNDCAAIKWIAKVKWFMAGTLVTGILLGGVAGTQLITIIKLWPLIPVVKVEGKESEYGRTTRSVQMDGSQQRAGSNYDYNGRGQLLAGRVQP